VGGDGKVTINGISHGDLIYQQNSELSSVAGLPGLVLPAGLGRSGLPVSLEIDGTIGNDQRLLAIGAALAEILTPLPPPRLGHA
jgi:mandelamide amidase